MRTDNTYLLPVPSRAVTKVVFDNPSHQGAYQGSVDFAVPIGAPALAAADGVVSRVRDDSDIHGDDPEFGQDVNYISLLHENDEISEYLHLAAGSAKVRVGDKVKAGQEIAKTGLSGWLTAPHLHFMVYKKTRGQQHFQCLEVIFEPDLA
jgi:murein DD-endopeptidase MepM/ murein hydrolase activator NlpD